MAAAHMLGHECNQLTSYCTMNEVMVVITFIEGHSAVDTDCSISVQL